MLSFLLLSYLTLSHGAIKRHVILNTETALPSNGVSITANPQSTTTVDSNYNINVHFQDSYDIKLALDNSWGFESRTISTLTFTMDGFTPFPQHSADVVIVFSVNNFQYFSFSFHLDTNHYIDSKIYPSVSMHTNTRKVSEWLSDTHTIHPRSRRVSNDNEWITLQQWHDQSLWPLKFVITNNPKSQQSTFQFYHNTTDSFAVEYVFNASFVPAQSTDIYVMGLRALEMFSISSFDLLLTNHSTAFPTTAPTQRPTDTTHSPTQHTVHPTSAPINRLYPEFTTTLESISDANQVYTTESQRHKSQAIVIVVAILMSVIAFFGVVVLCMKCCKPVNSGRKVSFDHGEERRSDTESTEIRSEYMNEGPLTHTRFRIPTSSVSNSVQTKHSHFVIVKDIHADVSPQLSSQSVPSLASGSSLGSSYSEDTVICRS